MSVDARDYPHLPPAIVSGVFPVPLVLAGLVVLTTLVFVFATGTSFVTNPLEIGGPPYP
jgi:hypothetical protein